MKANIVVKLSERDHVLLRPNQYIGSVDPVTSEQFVIDTDKITKKELTYVPAFIKIVNEIIDNSVDEATRTNFTFANQITIVMADGTISIHDNGRGIPVVPVEGMERYAPDVAFCEARAGANFNDDDGRETIGMNGVGSFATNCFSKHFHVETADGKKKFILDCYDNLSRAEHKISKSSDQYTKVAFTPDLERFGLKEIDQVYKDVIKQRLFYLSICYPLIKFKFNGDTVKVKNGKDFVRRFSEHCELIEQENYFISVMPSPSDDFSFFSYVNGLYVKNGGNHIDMVLTEVVSRIREKLEKKYPNIKPGDIKNKLQIVMFMNRFQNARFDSQSKETLTNNVTSIKEYLNLTTEDWDKFVAKIYKNPALMDSITETYRIKEELRRQKDLEDVTKTKKRIDVENYIAPTQEKKYIVFSEGLSANSRLMSVLGRDKFGYYAITGKFLNTQELSFGKISTNDKIIDFIKVLGINISNPDTDMDFENVLIATDADLDGIHIRGLLLTFFNRFAPKLIASGRVKVLATPMIVASSKGKIVDYFMGFDEYQKYHAKNPNMEYKYYKGLGTWKQDDLKGLLQKHGLDKFIETFEYDETSQKAIKEWMGSEFIEVCRGYLKERKLDLFKA
jgi:DNA gyrase/topoisomerase IV subunit B